MSQEQDSNKSRHKGIRNSYLRRNSTYGYKHHKESAATELTKREQELNQQKQ